MAPIPTTSSRVPKVSVVMAMYNRAAEIEQAVESVIAQDYDDYEIIVVDDGSTDGSGDIVKRFGDKVHLIQQENGGVGAARNRGIRAARGQYLAYCDCDDVQLPFRLRAQAELLDKFPQAAMVFSDFKTYVNGEVHGDSHLRIIWLGPTVRTFETEITDAFDRVATCEALGITVPGEYQHRRIFDGNVAPLVALMHLAWGCVQMTRIAKVREVGGHWEAIRAYEDWALTGELSKRYPLVFMDLPTILYRVHPEQLTGRARLNNACYRDVVHHVWRQDWNAYQAHQELIDKITGNAYAQIAEMEAEAGHWNEAEENFRAALSYWPKLKRAYPNLALSMARTKVPFVRDTPFDRWLPRTLKSADEDRG